MTVTSLSASLQNQTYAASDRLCQIAVNRKLLRIIFAKSRKTANYRENSKSGVNFQVALKQNRTKRNSIKRDLPVFGAFLLSKAVDEVGPLHRI
jgi:hypothetical protein